MKIVLDLDGVLVDFVGGIFRHLDIIPQETWPTPGKFDSSAFGVANIWDGLRHDFWEGLQWNLDGPDILKMCEAAVGKENIVICTSPALHPEGASGKMAWIQRELKDYRRRFFIGSAKHFLANPNTILVDDFEKNVSDFQNHGGKAILVSRPWNLNYELDTLSHIKHNLRILTQ